MTFLAAAQAGTGATSTLTFTMQFNSVRITSGGVVTTIRCSEMFLRFCVSGDAAVYAFAAV
jgi:hypothetical protein